MIIAIAKRVHVVTTVTSKIGNPNIYVDEQFINYSNHLYLFMTASIGISRTISEVAAAAVDHHGDTG